MHGCRVLNSKCILRYVLPGKKYDNNNLARHVSTESDRSQSQALFPRTCTIVFSRNVYFLTFSLVDLIGHEFVKDNVHWNQIQVYFCSKGQMSSYIQYLGSKYYIYVRNKHCLYTKPSNCGVMS